MVLFLHVVTAKQISVLKGSLKAQCWRGVEVAAVEMKRYIGKSIDGHEVFILILEAVGEMDTLILRFLKGCKTIAQAS